MEYPDPLRITKDGDLYGSGNNRYGQLGIADKVNRITFEKITLS